MKSSLAGPGLALLALVMLALGWGQVFAPLNHTTFGIALRPDPRGAAIAQVRPGTPAQALGLHRGDTVLISDLSLSNRHRLMIDHSPLGTTLSVPIVHDGRQRIVTLRAVRRQTVTSAAWMNLVSITITLLIMAVIAWRRPSLATAALVWFGAGAATTYWIDGQFTWIPNPWFGFASVVIQTAIGTLPQLALLPFVVRFPRDPVAPGARLRMHVADGLFIASAVGLTFESLYEPLVFSSWQAINIWGAAIIALVTLAFTAFCYRDAAGEDRRRIGWVIAGLVVATLAYSAFNIGDTYLLYTGNVTGVAWLGIAQLFQCALPVALGYAILRHRVLDVGFVVNRTMVYATVTTVAVLVVSCVDWLTTRLLTEQRLALAVEAFVTIAFGFALNRIHGATERFIDRIVFRQRHLAEKRIEYRIGALGFASSTRAVDETLAVESAEILDLAWAAVFVKLSEQGGFERRAASGWPTGILAGVGVDSLLVRTLCSLERAFFLDDAAISLDGMPSALAQHALAVPIASQHELIGFALYGSHRDGASLDPEELALLTALTHAAANAYGAVEARHWRERVTALEASMQALSPT